MQNRVLVHLGTDLSDLNIVKVAKVTQSKLLVGFSDSPNLVLVWFGSFRTLGLGIEKTLPALLYGLSHSVLVSQYRLF